jgi:hypothetical protein
MPRTRLVFVVLTLGFALAGLPATTVASREGAAVQSRTPGSSRVASPTTPKGVVAAHAGPFSMNLFRRGDFVTQYTKEWCVAAALQIMLNVTGKLNDRSQRTQVRLFNRALSLSRNRGRMTTERGWAATLNAMGVGPYEVRSTRTREAAIAMAAEAIRRTNRPAGLLTWWGAHSWVMTGFSATADPAAAGDFRVTAVFVSDPWYPKVSSIWGPSLPPNSRMTIQQLRVDYIPWIARAGRTRLYSGKYVLIVPVAPPVAAVTRRLDERLFEPQVRPSAWPPLAHDVDRRWLL